MTARRLRLVEGMTRQDRLNWQIRFAGHDMVGRQLREFGQLFGAEASVFYEREWRDKSAATLRGVTMTSDGYLPFRDNVELAAAFGVTTIVEPGGSTRTSEVIESAASHGITRVETGARLFHH